MSCNVCITKMTRHLTMLYIGILFFTVSYLCCSWDLLVAVVFSLSFISKLRLRLCSYTPTYVLSLTASLVYLFYVVLVVVVVVLSSSFRHWHYTLVDSM